MHTDALKSVLLGIIGLLLIGLFFVLCGVDIRTTIEFIISVVKIALFPIYVLLKLVAGVL